MANRFLQQLEDKQPSPQPMEAPPPKATNNRFINQLQNRPIAKTDESELSRLLMQTAIGGAQGAVYRSPAGVPAALADLAFPGAVQNVIGELLESDVEHQALYPGEFPKLNREKIEEGAAQAQEKALGGEGLLGGLITAPLRLAGIDTRPKGTSEKVARLASTAALGRGGSVGQKATAGAVAPSVSQGLQAIGLPEQIADMVGLAAAAAVPGPKFNKATKESGLTSRRFENLKKETKISPERHAKITQSVEQDFKKLADQLLEKNKTYSAMKEDTLFKEKIRGLFEEVSELAKNVEGTMSPSQLRSSLRKRAAEQTGKGITPNEFERAYRKEFRRLNKVIPLNQFTLEKGVEQFRKNNESLGEYFEPGKSSAHNRAKKQALLDYNRSLEEVFERNYPDSEFNKLFKFTNKRWQEISDIEATQGFINDLFDGKIDYKKARQLFNRDKEHVARPFKRLLGDEHFKQFEKLTENLLSTEKGYAQLKKAESEGYKDLFKIGSSFLLHQKIGAVYSAVKAPKYAKKLMNMALDKPQLTVEWENALSNLNKGDFSKAEKGFKKLESAVKGSEK